MFAKQLRLFQLFLPAIRIEEKNQEMCAHLTKYSETEGLDTTIDIS